MTKRHLLLSAAVMALMIGGTSPAVAQYYRDYKPNDKPSVEVDMGVLGGSSAPETAPGYVPPVTDEALPAAVAAPAPRSRIISMPPEPAPVRVLKPSGTPPAEQPEVAVQEEAPAAAKPYRPYLTTPAPQPVRSYPPAPTPKTVEREMPAPVTAPRPVRSYPVEPMPEVAEQEPAAPLQQPMPKPAAAKKYEPSPSVVDNASYKPDYSGYYKSGTPVPAAIANVEQKQPHQSDIAEQLTEQTAPPEKTAAAEELTARLPEPQSQPQLEPLPEIATERSIEQTPPPAAPMAPIISDTRQPAKAPARIISYPDSTVVTRPTPTPAAAAPVQEEKIVSLPAPQRKPAPQPEPVIAAAPVKRPSLEILDTPPPPRPVEKPVTVKTGEDMAESIVPPTKEEGKADISKLAEQVDNATAEMATAPALPALDEPPKFASVPTHSDLTLEFPGNSSDLTSATQRKLDAIVRQMEDLVDGGRLQVRGYAAGEDGSKSSARRIALSRALSVRSYLMDKGVKAKRVDVRAMGSETDRNPLDRVDLIFQR